jgi:S-adenosylmethionine synthetase
LNSSSEWGFLQLKKLSRKTRKKQYDWLMSYLFTSESVAIGHPDKVADQISDAILDACLLHDPHARVACECLVSTGLVIIAGEITSTYQPDYQKIARETIKDIGYDDCALGFDWRSCGIITTVNKQSPDIAEGVFEGKGLFQEQGAGDQGIMFGFASDETEEFMPMPIALCNRIVRELNHVRIWRQIPYLRPDAKTQITIEYDENHTPKRLDTVVISVQHDEGVSHEKLEADMKGLIHKIVPSHLIDTNTLYYINPTGRFVLGGPAADCGVTGRKLIVDTYGGTGRHGGGCFSGKDPSKVDRSAAYAARYVAKNVVAAKLARRCEVQLSYAIGIPFPISIKVDTFGTSSISEERLAQAIRRVFDLTPKGIIDMLRLLRPIYQKTAFGGHFGRSEPTFTWERIDRVDDLLKAANPAHHLL